MRFIYDAALAGTVYHQLYGDREDDIVAAFQEAIRDRADLPEYASRYDGIAPSSVTALSDIADLPLLTDDQAITTVDDRVDLFFRSCRDRMVTAKSTSGTTSGAPTICFWDATALDRTVDTIRRGIDDVVAADDRALVVITEELASVVRRTFMSLDAGVSVATPYDLPMVRDIAAGLEPTCIYTTPTMATRLGALMDAAGITDRMRYLVLTGEPVTGAQRADLRDQFPEAEIRQHYGLTEVGGGVAFQCSEHAGRNRYHVRQDGLFLEVVDPDTGDPCSVGERGELVVAVLEPASATPVLRYRTGDNAEWIEADCDCDASRLLLRLHGRITFDAIKLGGITVYQDRFEEALQATSDLLRGSYQIHVHETDDAQPYLRIEAVPRTDFRDADAAQRKAAEKLMHQFAISNEYTWADAVEKGGVLAPIQVDFVEEVGDVKTQKVVDHRST